MVRRQLTLARQDPRATVAGGPHDVAVPLPKVIPNALAWYNAAPRLVPGQPTTKEPGIAKFTASNAATDNARSATQVFVGCRPMNDFPFGRFSRDAKLPEIGQGTLDVQCMLIFADLA